MPSTFGEKMHYFRKERNLSMDDVSRKIGISKQALSNYERDINSPKISTAVMIANSLGVRITDLLSDELLDPNYEPTPVQEDHFDHEITVLARNASNLKKVDRRIVKNLVDSLLRRTSEDDE